MNKTLIVAFSVASVACLIALYFWSTNNRYYIMAGAGGIAYEVDRKTGNTWELSGGQKTLQEQNEPPTIASNLPPWEIQKLSGEGQFYDADLGGHFDVSLYNGTSWHIQVITVTITAKNQDGTVRWTRQYKKDLAIEPLSNGTLIFDVSDIKDATAEWQISDVRGFLPK